MMSSSRRGQGEQHREACPFRSFSLSLSFENSSERWPTSKFDETSRLQTLRAREASVTEKENKEVKMKEKRNKTK
eukprot:scaffold208419_cov24-Tisochrysis_lutea.AAC.1